MFSELAANFRSFQAGSETFKTRFYVAHDGSMIRLASGLGLGKLAPLRWPALGSEMVMEVSLPLHAALEFKGQCPSFMCAFQVWKTPKDGMRVRVMHEGTPVSSLAWISLSDFITLLESQVPANIFEACNA
jgi:2-phosphoxylose phosphatase